MKTRLAAVALAATLAQSAAATTFPSLTTIYVVAGVRNTGISFSEEVTAFICSNVSGVNTAIRVLVLSSTGAVINAATAANVPHGATHVFATSATHYYSGETVILTPPTSGLEAGVANIESLQSGVFCTAAIYDDTDTSSNGRIIPHLVRVNPHPGTVE